MDFRCVLAQVAITKYHRLDGWLKQQTFNSHGSRGWECQDQGDWVLSESLLSGLQTTVSHCILTWQGVRTLLSSSSCKGNNTIIGSLPSCPYLNLITSQIPPPPNAIILRIRVSTHEFGRNTNIQSITGWFLKCSCCGYSCMVTIKLKIPIERNSYSEKIGTKKVHRGALFVF